MIKNGLKISVYGYITRKYIDNNGGHQTDLLFVVIILFCEGLI